MTVHIASRASWGARHNDGDITLHGLAEGVSVHHSVTEQLSPNASVEQERAQMRVLESIGESRFGYGIAGNVVVFPSGGPCQGGSLRRGVIRSVRRVRTACSTLL